jgi:hypothetical protein
MNFKESPGLFKMYQDSKPYIEFLHLAKQLDYELMNLWRTLIVDEMLWYQRKQHLIWIYSDDPIFRRNKYNLPIPSYCPK